MTAILDVLVSASLQGGLFGLAIWIVTSLVPAIPPRVRVWLWWLVSARLLLALVPAPAIEIPWGVAATETATAGTRLGEVVALAMRTTVDMAVPDGPVTAVATSPPASAPVTWRISWHLVGTTLLVGVYALGLAWQLGRLTRDVRGIGHLLRQATDAPAVVVARARVLAAALGIGLPRVKESGRAQSPLVAGSVRPVVIVPARTERWAPRDLDLALAHELAHVRHGDLRWAWVPALAGRVFFFHPIARLAVREYVLAREAACDATAISLLHAEPEAYGRLLLTFGSAPATPLCAAARASTSFTTLKRRLVMLEHVRSSQSRWWWALVGAGALALVPFSLVAQPSPSVLPDPAPLTQADAQRVYQPDAPPPPPPAPPVPSAPPAPPAPPPVATAPALEPAPGDVPPAPPMPPVPPVAPVAPPHARAGHPDVSWVIFDEGTLEPETAAASKADREAARQARQGTEALVWFRRHGQTYVSRDPQVMTTVRGSFSEVEALGEQLSALGAQLGRVAATQGVEGADHAGIGAALSAHGAEVSKLTGVLLELEGLRMQAGTLTPSPEQAQRLADARARLEATKAEMKALAEQQRAKSRQARVQSAELRAESARVRAIGEQMRAAVTSAMSGVATAFDAAIADGRAQRHP